MNMSLRILIMLWRWIFEVCIFSSCIHRMKFLISNIDDALDVKHALGEWTGRDTFPNVFLGGESIGGANELIKLHQSGELRRMLEDNDLFPY